MSPSTDPRLAALWRNLLLFLVLNGLVRTALVAWNQDWSLFLPHRLVPALAIGAVFDFVAAAHLLVPAAWLLALWPARGRWALWTLALVWSLLALVVSLGLAFTALSEFTFWLEFNSRFNFVAVDYLVYSQEVIGNIRQSYNLPLLLALVVASALLLAWLQWRLVGRQLMEPSSLRLRHRLVLALAMTAVPLLTFAFVDASWKGFSSDAQLNEIAGNGYYDFFHAFRSNELDYERLYKTLSTAELGSHLKRHYATGAAEPQGGAARDEFTPHSWEREVRAAREERRLNVVLISMESMGAVFMQAHGGQEGLTPHLDQLAPQSLHFTRVYATGTRTVRGLEALSLSVPPTPGHAIVARPANQGLFTLGHVLRERGYLTSYHYGGYSTFDNMKAFFGGNGYTVIDRTAINASRIHHETIWGVADEDLFDMALEQLDSQHSSGQPFFAHIMTTSNHRPYTYPEGRIDIPSKTGRLGGVKYTDYAVGRFIGAAKEKPWFRDTLFVIVADHTHNGRGKQELPPAAYHIPLLVYSPAHVAPQTIDSVASQIDVAPTILGLLGMSYQSRFFGQDILTEGQYNPRAFLANYQTVGMYRDGWVVELKPQQRVRVVRVDANAADVNPEELTRQAVMYYQAAAGAFRRGWLSAAFSGAAAPDRPLD